MSDISVMLTTYKRPQNLGHQLAAVRGQTAVPHNVSLFRNTTPTTRDTPIDRDCFDRVITCDTNVGVWARFLACMEFDTKYVAVFDDDTIPGHRWLQNCLDTIQQHRGLLGSVGVTFGGGKRGRRKRTGWASPNAVTRRVDIVGHCWFFERDWLREFAAGVRRGGPTCGEDYHFAYAVQRLGLQTYVPPHPPGKKDLWGSIEGKLGDDKVALYRQAGEDRKKAEMHARYVDDGFQLLEG